MSWKAAMVLVSIAMTFTGGALMFELIDPDLRLIGITACFAAGVALGCAAKLEKH